MVQKVEGHRQTVDFENECRKIWVNLINRHLFLPHLQMFVVIFNLKIEKKNRLLTFSRAQKRDTNRGNGTNGGETIGGGNSI